MAEGSLGPNPDAGMITEFLMAKGLNSRQQKVTQDLVLLLKEVQPIFSTKVWHTFNTTYKYNPTCKQLNVTKMTQFVDMISDLVQAESKPARYRLTKLGDKYAKSLQKQRKLDPELPQSEALQKPVSVPPQSETLRKPVSQPPQSERVRKPVSVPPRSEPTQKPVSMPPRPQSPFVSGHLDTSQQRRGSSDSQMGAVGGGGGTENLDSTTNLTAEETLDFMANIISSEGFNDHQRRALIEVVILLREKQCIDYKKFWMMFSKEYLYSPSCRDLGVLKLQKFFEDIISDFVQLKGTMLYLTGIGQQYAAALLHKVSSSQNLPADEDDQSVRSFPNQSSSGNQRKSSVEGSPWKPVHLENDAIDTQSFPALGERPITPRQHPAVPNKKAPNPNDVPVPLFNIQFQNSCPTPGLLSFVYGSPVGVPGIPPLLSSTPPASLNGQNSLMNSIGAKPKTKSKRKSEIAEEDVSSKPTPSGGETFLLETDIPNVVGNGGRTARPSRERLEALALTKMDEIANSGEFVTMRRVEVLILNEMNVRNVQILGLKKIEELNSVFELSRKIGQVDAHITASISLKNVITLSDLLEGMREGIPDKKPYSSLRLGPITKNPIVQRLLGVPSGSEVVEISCLDVYSHLRAFVRKNNLWRDAINIQDFMEHLKTEYEVDDVFELGIKIKSIALCMQVIKRAQRQEADITRSYTSTVETDTRKDLSSAYASFRTKILMENMDGSYSTREHYLSQQPKDVVVDVMNKFKVLIDTVKELGYHSLDADLRALENVKNLLGKTKLVKELFQFAVIVSTNDTVDTVQDFLMKLHGEKEDKSTKQAKLTKKPKKEIVEKILSYLDRLLGHQGLTLTILKDLEKKCCQHFKRDTFTELGHEPFLEFLLENDQINQILEDNGGLHLGGAGASELTSLYHPSINDLLDMILILPTEQHTSDVVERMACHHYRIPAYKYLGLGSSKLVLDRMAQLKLRKARNVVLEVSLCADSKLVTSVEDRRSIGALGHQNWEAGLVCLYSCPLLEDLAEWSQWKIIFEPDLGNLKVFIEKHGGTRQITYKSVSITTDLHALETEPGKFLRLTSDTSEDRFRDAVESGSVSDICGHLVSLVHCRRGFKSTGLTLLSNVILARLHEMNAVTPGAPPLDCNPPAVFVLECLSKLPLKFCEKVADVLFLEPLNRVIGQAESKRLVAASCHTMDQTNRLIVLGHILGINEWMNLFHVRLSSRPVYKTETAPELHDDGDDNFNDSFSDCDDDDLKIGALAWSSSEDESDVEVDEDDSHTATHSNQEEHTAEDSLEETNNLPNDKVPVNDRQEDIIDPNLTVDTNCNEDVVKGEESDISPSHSVHEEEPTLPLDGQLEEHQVLDERDFRDGVKKSTDEVEEQLNQKSDEVGESEIQAPSTDVQESVNTETEVNAGDDDSCAKADSANEDHHNNKADSDNNDEEDDFEDDPDLSDIERQSKRIIHSIRRDEFGCGVELDDKARKLIDKQHARLERSLKRLSHDLYTKDTHFVLELVQNSDDNNYDDAVKYPSMHFVIEGDKITILNNEIGFEEKNVRALCDVGNSTKPKHNLGYIGQKGIGFKSVFKVTDRPEIHSRGYHFCFDMKNDSMGYILPNWISDPTPNDKWTTKIVLPLKQSSDQNVQSLTNRFRDIHPSLLLFLHRLKSITIENKIDGSRNKMIRRDLGKNIIEIRHNKKTERWLVQRQLLDVSKLSIQIKGGVEVAETEIAIAFPLNSDAIPERQSVFSFLPLRGYGFRFVIQGDFDLPSSREDLDSDSSWNQWLRKEISPVFVSALDLFKRLDEDPVQAIKHFLSFVAREDEIMDFFKPVAREIFRQLSSKSFLPVAISNTDEKLNFKMPSQLVMCKDQMVRQTFTGDLLSKYLNVSYLHPDLVTDGNSTLLYDMGVKYLTTNDLLHIVQSLALDWSSLPVDEIILTNIARILVCIQRNLDDLDLHDKTLTSLREIALIPDCNKQPQLHVINAAAIFFPLKTESKGSNSSALVARDLNIVNPRLMELLDNVSNSQVVDILERLGVKEITPEDVIRHHILPVFTSDQWQTKERNVLTNYVLFMCEYHDQLTSVISWEDLAEVVQLNTNRGLKNPSRDAIHFSVNYGNRINLPITFPSYKWTILDQYGSGRENEKWRWFFMQLGVLDFLSVKKEVKKVKYSDLDGTQWDEVKALIKDKDATVDITDWVSLELESLINNALASPESSHVEMQSLFNVLSSRYGTYGKYIEAEIVEATAKRHIVPSSFARILTSSAWLPGYMTVVLTFAESPIASLYCGRDLYLDNNHTRPLLANTVPYLNIKINNAGAEAFLKFLQIKTQVNVAELREYFLEWTKTEEEPFITTAEHLREVYTRFASYMTLKDYDDLFKTNPSIFVPEEEHRNLLAGRFYNINDVCWADPGNLFTKYAKELEESSMKPVRALEQYRLLYPKIPHHDILDIPEFNVYRDLLEFICTYYPKCEDKYDDVMRIYDILANKILVSQNVPIPNQKPQSDWRSEFSKLRIIPTKRDIYVQCSQSPMFADNGTLENLFSEDDRIHFVGLSAPKASTKRSKSKPKTATKGSAPFDLDLIHWFFTDIVGVKELSESVRIETQPEGVDFLFAALKNYFHNFIPSLQRFLYYKHEDLYNELIEADIQQIITALKFSSAFKLEAVYTMKHDLDIVRVEQRNCHISHDERIVYVRKEAMKESRDIQKEIADYFSFSREDLSSIIREFLMSCFPDVDNPTKCYANVEKDYKLKPLPEDEEVWEVEEVVVFIPPPPPPPPVPEIQPLNEVDSNTEVVNNAPLLRSWPPPALGSGMKKRPANEPPSNWPRPPTPDSVDTLPEKLRTQKTSDVRPLHPTEAHGISAEGMSNKKTEGRSKESNASKPGPLGDVIHGGEKTDGTDLAGPKSNSVRDGNIPNSRSDGSRTGLSGAGDQESQPAKKPSPHEITLGDFVQTENNQPVVVDGDGKTVTIGTLPQTTAPHSGTNVTPNAHPRSVRTFAPDNIDDIPNERVFFETGNRGNIATQVEIHLDVATDQKRIGHFGEEMVYKYLVARLGQLYEHTPESESGVIIAGVKWLNQSKESGSPYDIELMLKDKEREYTQYIEVKSTMSDGKMYFETSAQELHFAMEQRSRYDLYRVFNVGDGDRIKLVKLTDVANGLENKAIRVFMVV